MEFIKRFIKLDINYINSSEKIIPLDGLRGFAVLLVVFFHCFDYSNVSYFGWMGVDLFFVLSGFLISGILIDVKNEGNYYKNFFGKRVLRIFPLYYLALLIITIIAFLNLKTDYAINTPNIYYWLYIQNWELTFTGKFSKENPLLGHFWSLAVEEQFYIFWPFVIKRFNKNSLIYIIISFITLAILLRIFFFAHDNIGYYVNTFARLDALCVGSLIAVLIRFHKEILKKFVFYIFIISSIFILVNAKINGPFFSHALMAKFGLTIVALFWGSVLLYAISKKNILSKFFSFRFFTFFGKYSYGMYVYHAILYIMLITPTLSYLENVGFSGSLVRIFASISIILLSVLVSLLSFNLFEKRFTKYRKYFHPKPEKILKA